MSTEIKNVDLIKSLQETLSETRSLIESKQSAIYAAEQKLRPVQDEIQLLLRRQGALTRAIWTLEKSSVTLELREAT